MANSTDCGTLRGSIGHAVLKAENASRGLDIPEPALILTEVTFLSFISCGARCLQLILSTC